MNPSGLINLIPETVQNEFKQSGTYPEVTIFDAFQDQVRKQPNAIAICSSTESYRFQQIHAMSVRLAHALKKQGLIRGDTIVYQLSNSWRCMVIDIAAAALGVTVCPIPTGRGRLDIESVLKRSQARAIIVENQPGAGEVCEIIEVIRPLMLALRCLITVGEPKEHWHHFDKLLQHEPLETFPYVSPDDPVRLLVSSGSESEPKLVAYTHNSLLGGRGRFMAKLSQGAERFVPLYLMPLGSAFGSTASSCVMTWLGGTVVILSKFTVDAALEAIERFKPSHILGVPTMFQRLTADERLGELDLSHLVAIVSGGALIDEATIHRCRKSFGCPLISLYGSADGVNCFNSVDDGIEKVVSTVGRPDPTICEIRIVDAQHQSLEHGEVGEICARGPISPMQYVNSPRLDETYRDQGGWVYTGDLGCIDDEGYLHLMGRKKDVIIRGGANISPAQIEKLMTSHPLVVSAACVAVPDEDLGQRVCLCLSLKHGQQPLSLNEIGQYLQSKGLEKHKLPEYISHFSQLPLSPAGKVDKSSIHKMLSELSSYLPSTRKDVEQGQSS